MNRAFNRWYQPKGSIFPLAFCKAFDKDGMAIPTATRLPSASSTNDTMRRSMSGRYIFIYWLICPCVICEYP